jgi:hypothetical protein
MLHGGNNKAIANGMSIGLQAPIVALQSSGKTAPMWRMASMARKQEIALVRRQASANAARVRARMSSELTRARARVNAIRVAERAKAPVGAALAGGGAVMAGQLARMQLFPDAQGQSRSHLLNFGIGAVALAALATGRVRSNEAMAAAAFGVGVGIGQLAITSYTQWDLVPGNLFGA